MAEVDDCQRAEVDRSEAKGSANGRTGCAMWRNCSTAPTCGPRPLAFAIELAGNERNSNDIPKRGGPFLFGKITMADAMYAPVVSRFRTYGIKLDGELKSYAERIWDLPAMQEWRDGAMAEHEEIEELEAEF